MSDVYGSQHCSALVAFFAACPNVMLWLCPYVFHYFGQMKALACLLAACALDEDCAIHTLYTIRLLCSHGSDWQ